MTDERHLGLRDQWDVLLVVGAGGSVGAAARWAVGTAMPTAAGHFPWSTFVINVTGSALLGVLMVLVVDVWPPRRYVRPFLGVGVLGGYTTFSTYALETRGLLEGGHAPLAAAYLVGSLLAGLLAVWLAVMTTRAALRGRLRAAS